MNDLPAPVPTLATMYREHKLSALLLPGLYLFGLAMIGLVDNGAAYDFNEWLADNLGLRWLIAFLDSGARVGPRENIGLLLALYLLFSAPVIFLLSMRAGVWAFAGAIVRAVRDRNEWQNFFTVAFLVVMLPVSALGSLFAVHALAAGCPGCTTRSLVFPFTINYLAIFSLGYFSSFLKQYVSALMRPKPLY